MYKIVLSPRIKYDDIRNRNSFGIRISSTVGFYSIEKHNSYLCLIFFFGLTQFDIFFVLGLRIKYDDNKIKTIVL